MRIVSHHANSTDGGFEDNECHVREIKFHPHTAFLASYREQCYEFQITPDKFTHSFCWWSWSISNDVLMSVSLHWPQSTVKFVFRKTFQCNRPQHQQQNVGSHKDMQGALLLHWHPSLEIRGNRTNVTPIIVKAYCIQLWWKRTGKVYPKVFSLHAFGIAISYCI